MRGENNMKNETKIYITANELAEILGISVGHSYKIIRSLNKELDKKVILQLQESFHVNIFMINIMDSKHKEMIV